MPESVVLVDKAGGIATVTLNRPEKLNALNHELRSEFCRAMQALRGDPETRVVIITGAGRGFCAGLDLRELATDTGRETTLRDNSTANFVTVIEDMEVPVIAAVNGFAVTGGFEIVLACDLIVASEDAQFADTHARVGVMPGGRMSARLPRAIGIRKAKEMSFTGNYLNARDAERMGLVNRVVPSGDALNEAKALAAQILTNNQLMVRQLKRLYDMTDGVPLPEAMRTELDFQRAYDSASKMKDFAGRREAVMERGRSQTSQKH